MTLSPTRKSLDLSAFAGQTVRLRSAAAVTETFLRAGVDDVAIRAFDITAPATTVDEGPAEGATTADPTPTFAFASDEPGSTFECAIDDATPAPRTSPFVSEALADGDHTFSVTATDAAGNVQGTPTRRAFTVRRPEPTRPRRPSG